MNPQGRSRSFIRASAAFLLLHATVVRGVDLTQCSSQNTGSGSVSSSSIYMSDGKCSDSCGGYSFAITQGQNCWCSDYAPGDTADLGSCDEKCPGYPFELCGSSSAGLYGYVALGKTPLGTQGGSSRSSAPSTSEAPSSQYTPPSSSAPETTINSVVSTQVFVPPESSIESPPPSTTAVTVVKTATPKSSSHSSTWSATPTTQTQLVTVSGAVVTQVVTSTPTAPATDDSLPHATHSGLSDGAVAGATIGALLGAALIGAALFLCWRRRRSTKGDTEGVLSRNTSVLSRTGLLGSNREEAVAGVATLPRVLPRIQTSGMPLGHEIDSAATGASSQMSENKRNSRPMFVDNRLNPNALMMQSNASRTSIGTLQDNQDYSRRLEVRNPDT